MGDRNAVDRAVDKAFSDFIDRLYYDVALALDVDRDELIAVLRREVGDDVADAYQDDVDTIP